ncbi:MAG: hypothetical protein KBD52_00525 [Candidatus Pacebacteria bacterium]|nr:hypothetical protein [Candidatus Paceibacterota bacterium]
MYNIHPIIVHFPIAFLFIYSVIKILPFSKWMPSVSWKQIERVILLVGFLGALAANSTGEIAEDLVRPNHQLVEAHSFFAGASILFYGLILLGEILTLLIPFMIQKLNIVPLIKLFTFFEKLLTNKALVLLLAFLGIISISITGMLGGVMVYGLSADPLAPIILKMLGITL